MLCHMQTIWKYDFDVSRGEHKVGIPLTGEVVHVAAQLGMVCCWVLVDTKYRAVEREFVIHGTGHPVEANEKYLGTAHIHPFVWHLFEKLAHNNS